ncbi:hypothetical protein ANN_18162 [Periplaneta americana]|uniref:Reverse transcriptase n=1 Tax=Periplaneta americana TaxID=6978 RepID=A0ABQ8SP88_PERAM|nr:hypothetical protein ANN_18162 [Periplaneta americana]
MKWMRRRKDKRGEQEYGRDKCVIEIVNLLKKEASSVGAKKLFGTPELKKNVILSEDVIDQLGKIGQFLEDGLENWKVCLSFPFASKGSGRQHSLKCAKVKRSRPVCSVVQQEEVEGIPAATSAGWCIVFSAVIIANTIPVRTLPGRTLDSTRCRRCDEQETLPHVLGFCHHGELLRINRHNTVRSLIAASIRQNASYEVYEEVGCVSSDGSTRRADIIIIDRQKDKGVILDPTIRFEMHEQQPQEVVIYGCETLRGEHRLRVFENKVLSKIFGAKRDEVTGEWRKLHNTELHALYSSPDIIRNIKSRRLRWAGHVARMGESRNAYRVLVGRPEGRRPLGRPRRRWENIKVDLREVGYDD